MTLWACYVKGEQWLLLILTSVRLLALFPITSLSKLVKSSWGPVISGAPQTSISGPVQSNVSGDDLDDRTEGTISKFVGDTELVGVVDTPDGCTVIQRDLARLEKPADGNPCKDLQSLASGAGEPQAPVVGTRGLETRSVGQAPS